uniref:Ig-like domain-containing protein n=1 Tax=Ornithorhynchus anatinus TaxID=9258 RepID=F6RIE0_ORNAN
MQTCFARTPSFLSISFVTAQFSVIGPVKPILVLVGEDAKLPCHLEPKTSAKDMEVRWFRTHASNVVHLCQNGTDHLGEQLEGYRGRTELLRDAIANGSLAVRIHKVRASDDGQYCCSFQHELRKTSHSPALGSDPHIRMEWYKGGGIWMECTSAGWYPEPVVRWRDARGQTVPALSESRPRARDGLYGVAVSLVVRDDSVGMVSCSIWNPRLGQEKKTCHVIQLPAVDGWSPEWTRGEGRWTEGSVFSASSLEKIHYPISHPSLCHDSLFLFNSIC